MDVHHLRLVSSHGIPDATLRCAGPDRRRGESKVPDRRPRFTQLGIVEDYLPDIEPSLLEQAPFGPDDLVLTARMPVAGMDLQHPLNGTRLAHVSRCRGVRRMTTSPSPNSVQNQIPPWGPSRYGSKDVLTIIALQ